MNKIIWLCGLSGSGKTTLGKILANKMEAIHLDSDDIRKQFWPYLGLSEDDRKEHIRGMSQLSQMVFSRGSSCVVSCIAPKRNVRFSNMWSLPNLYLYYLDADYNTRKQRDPKGLYTKFTRNEMEVGPDGKCSFEIPNRDTEPYFRKAIDTVNGSIVGCVKQILRDIYA